MQQETNELARALTPRHIQMIAIGGAIGTGLFLGSGTAIKAAGPSIVLAYIVTGIFCYLMMRAIGELLLSNVKIRSFIDFVRIYLGPRWEFVTGWTYWLCWTSLAMADLTASGIYLRYWFPTLPQWITPLIVIIALLAINLMNVGWFGEMESAFAGIKVIAILALIIVGAIMIFTGFQSGDNVASFANLYQHGGFFATGLSGFLLAFPLVIFAFTGIEMVGLTAGETENPEVDLPKAINAVPIRIGLFYVGAVLVIMSIYPWNSLSGAQSPFVQVFAGIGIKAAAGIVNFVVLTSAMSAANSAIFSTSRTMYVMAENNHAPKWFAKLSKRQVPVNALVTSAIFLLSIVLLNYFVPSQIFVIISGVATISFIFVWLILLITHLKYRRVTKKLATYQMPGFPILNYLTIAFFVGVLGILLCQPDTRISVIGTVIFVAVLLFVYRLMNKKAVVKSTNNLEAK
ncbi:amino acid permease [Periweissella fabaria]|uniref:D-serine/D-alanine/glycine transporter n=1 Tax=Periweissella fabaria TaxID=546157 RepID=A0ABM8Z3C6_9LACO|nr:amino acid permease [Periweissella fabaria]MCM0596543.1 amino acid permease [Periweissella fabaria]CAH0415728.1 D-serine/D-alanine/glycine transporter [Periweissella fabaria]